MFQRTETLLFTIIAIFVLVVAFFLIYEEFNPDTSLRCERGVMIKLYQGGAVHCVIDGQFEAPSIVHFED